MQKTRRQLAAAGVMMLACGVWSAAARPTSAASSDPTVARVGRLDISRAELEDRFSQARAAYRGRTGQALPEAVVPTFRRTVLEQLIRARLLMLEAEKEGRLVSEEDAEAELSKSPFFSEDGHFVPSKLAAAKRNDPKAFAAALADARLRLSGARLQERIERRFAPDEAKLRAAIMRQLTTASLDALVLSYDDYDGRGAEPSERDVLDYYAGHKAEFERPAHAKITVLSVEPIPADDEGAASRQARDAHVRERADSLLAAARDGTPLASLAGTARLQEGLDVSRGNFPGLWRGDDRARNAVFSSRPGELLPVLVPGRDGWLIVRVDEVSQRAPAPLVDVARDIRARLRAARRSGSSDAELRRDYDDMRDELAGPAVRVRYALFDSSRIEVARPSSTDLDRYYRGHLADYSSFDAARGAIRQKPFEEVREDVQARWLRERRIVEARAAGERTLDAWRSGRRDRRTEKRAALLRETGPVAVGSPVDTLRFGALLGDTVSARGAREGTGMIAVPGGVLVFQMFDHRDGYVPPFEAVRQRVEARHARRLAAEETEAARRMFEADPMAFAHDSTVHFSRLVVPQPPPIDVPLTRAEVERYHAEHIDRYSAPEVVSLRQILVVPSGPGPGPDQAARLKAEGLLRRVRAGEDFNDLAQKFSDDLATRESGGDLGTFGRGVLAPAIEKVAFALRPGDVSDLVHTSQGYHILKCTGYEPMQARPLVQVYANVGFEAAMEKAVPIARARADSLMRHIHSPEDAIRIAASQKLALYHNTKAIGEAAGTPELEAYFDRLDELRPGQFYPTPVHVRGQGFAITWIDSITPPRKPRFEDVRSQVIAEYRRVNGAHALEAKRRELERMAAAGWSLDSLATLFGGLTRVDGLHAGDGLQGFGGAAQIDSLIFGNDQAPALQPGETSGWVACASGLVRVRLVARHAPPPGELAARLERDRRKELERSLYYYYEGLKRDYNVQIRDPDLAALALPPPTGADLK